MWGVVGVVVCLLLVGVGCQLDIQVGIDVDADGSGVVKVGVGMDDAAVENLGGIDNLSAVVKIDDLTAAGWTVTGPEKETDGLTWFRATKPFATPEEGTRVLNEVASGPFRDFKLASSRSFARTNFTFDGTVDFSKGIESFSDEDLTAALGGEPLGQDAAAIEQQFGGALDRLIHIAIAVRLPGEVDSNAPTAASNGAVWKPVLSDTTPFVVIESRLLLGRAAHDVRVRLPSGPLRGKRKRQGDEHRACDPASAKPDLALHLHFGSSLRPASRLSKFRSALNTRK